MQKFTKVNMSVHLAEDIEALEAQNKEIDSEWLLMMHEEVAAAAPPPPPQQQ